jgi:NADH-quinone oxidoreductase subunit M
MSELHFPWLEAAILFPLVGAILLIRVRNAELARKWCLLFSGASLVCAISAWQDFEYLHATLADDRWHLLSRLIGREIFMMDQLSAPLLPLMALLYFFTIIATVRTKVRRFSFAWSLVSESLALAIFCCKEPWGIIGLLAAGTVIPYLELRARGKPTRVYVLHMALYVGLMILGWSFVQQDGTPAAPSLWAIVPLLIAILIRNGIVPFHCWMTDLFEHATFGTALLFVTSLNGAYAAVRLVLPIAPDWVLRSIGLLSLVTAVYAAGMSLVQRDARRFFCYLFLSHSALILVGLEMVTPLGLTGALCVWLSACLALGGFGLTLRALESRRGRLSLADFNGLYEHTPNLAMCFVLTGLASVGFPGTFGFVGSELLVDSAVEAYPYFGICVVLAAALNGIAIVQAYFLLFTGKRYTSSVSLKIHIRERYAVLALAALILIGGLVPQPGVESRHRAALQLLQQRAALATEPPPLVDSASHAQAD